MNSSGEKLRRGKSLGEQIYQLKLLHSLLIQGECNNYFMIIVIKSQNDEKHRYLIDPNKIIELRTFT